MPDPPTSGALTAPQVQGAFVPAAQQLGVSQALAQEATGWNLTLPPDMRRAGLEIYRSIRAAGASSIREWISQEFRGPRQGALWCDLWHSATQVDFILARASSGPEVLEWLATDDTLDIILRRVFLLQHFRRFSRKAAGFSGRRG